MAGAANSEAATRTMHGMEYRSGIPAVCPCAATISGEGVSPAASAAASGSPPGSATITASALGGRFSGSGSRHRRMTFSTAGSTSDAIDDMLVRCADSSRSIRCWSDLAS